MFCRLLFVGFVFFVSACRDDGAFFRIIAACRFFSWSLLMSFRHVFLSFLKSLLHQINSRAYEQCAYLCIYTHLYTLPMQNRRASFYDVQARQS